MEGTRLGTGGNPGDRRWWGISGSTIKIIAVVTMLIDHTAAVVLARYLIGGMNAAALGGTYETWRQESAIWYEVYEIMRAIGRLGFPLFCFLLVEGYQRTSDVKKYALRLGLFALISEVPFDLAICGRAFHPGYQNVYFTLLLGLLALCAYGYFGRCGQQDENLPALLRAAFMVTGVLLPMVYVALVEREAGRTEIPYRNCLVVGAVILAALVAYGAVRGLRNVQTACADLTVLALCMTAAMYLQTDYSGMGVLTITAMYVFRKRRALAMLAGCIVLCVMSFGEAPALVTILPIALYNGKRGLRMKYFFYAFYPAHLMLLYAAAVLVGLGSVVLL